jgi:molecular chaperone GrpE
MTVTNPTPETEPHRDDVRDDTDLVEVDNVNDVAEEMPATDAIDPLEQVTKERDEYLDDLRRQRAEFENYRKRVANDSAVQRTLGRYDTVLALLEFADDLDRLSAAAAESEHAENDLIRAIELLDSKWRHALASLKVERIDAVGVEFDPNQHDAVSQIPAEEPQDTPMIAQVMRVGYRSADRVLRPAMVVVAQ